VVRGWHRIRLVRRLAEPLGFGRIHVVRVKAEGLPRYLSKYISKGAVRESPCLRGWRLWATFGVDAREQTRCIDMRSLGTLQDRIRGYRDLGHSAYRSLGMAARDLGGADLAVLQGLACPWGRGVRWDPFARRSHGVEQLLPLFRPALAGRKRGLPCLRVNNSKVYHDEVPF